MSRDAEARRTGFLIGLYREWPHSREATLLSSAKGVFSIFLFTFGATAKVEGVERRYSENLPTG